MNIPVIVAVAIPVFMVIYVIYSVLTYKDK